jgi:hypothetical protein
MHETEVSALHESIGQDMREEAADKLDRIESDGTRPGTSRFAGREGDLTVLERHETAIGDGDPADLRGEGGDGRLAVWPGRRMDIPGDRPAPRVAVLEQARLSPVVFEHSPGEG